MISSYLYSQVSRVFCEMGLRSSEFN